MSTDASGAYDDLLERYRRIANLRNASQLLNWDQQVMMPEGGTPARSKQLSALSATVHERLTDEAVADLLADIESADLDEGRRAVVREVRRQYDRNASVPTDLVESISKASSEALEVWERASEEDDFEAFATFWPSSIKMITTGVAYERLWR